MNLGKKKKIQASVIQVKKKNSLHFSVSFFSFIYLIKCWLFLWNNKKSLFYGRRAFYCETVWLFVSSAIQACKEKGAQGQAPLGQHWGKPRDVGPCQVLLTGLNYRSISRRTQIPNSKIVLTRFALQAALLRINEFIKNLP